MKVYIGADHRGFALKKKIVPWLQQLGYDVTDMGSHELVPTDDYPDYAAAVGKQVSLATDAYGIVMCGSGVGVDIAANKINGVRSGFGASVEQILSARHDDNINVLAIGADFTDETKTQQLIQTFLDTKYVPNDRFERRISQVKQLEKNQP